MAKHVIFTFLLIVVVDLTFSLFASSSSSNDLATMNKLFKNPKTGKFITGKIEQIDKSVNSTAKFLQQYSFQGASCNCVDLVCSCCINLNLGLLLKDSNMCTNITLLPAEFSVQIGVSFNGKSFVVKIPANNPPATCIPVPSIPILNVCLRVKDLQFQNSTFHGCLDLEAKLTQLSLLVLHFDCININANGVETSKPKTNSTEKKQLLPSLIQLDVPSNFSLKLNE
ncbi:uncharacterized protein LOC122507399 [Leptopilina heterotoma]|uniref:uncharacterized protein LOC122507399 n=1 Tax=Leptopilina heterotoma TaxID=63436 RepID=UPI001CA7E91B|nr:uncharacterized protein LOC122507399 [Leptopilina heterotoma]